MNSLYQQLNKNPSSLSNAKNALNTLKNTSNPTQLLNTMAANNPRLKQVLTLVQSSNMSPKDLFYKMAKEKGVDPESILSQLR